MNLRENFKSFSHIDWDRIIKLDTGKAKPTKEELEIINNWAQVIQNGPVEFINPEAEYKTKKIRESFQSVSKLDYDRIIKLDTGEELATDDEVKLINDWVKRLTKTYIQFTPEESKAFEEILELYDLMEPNENSQRYILNLIASWFSDESLLQLEIKEEPELTDEAKEKIEKIKGMLNWSNLNPMLYTSVFESMMESDEKKKTGAYYTSRENIHKCIDPLFLDNLTERVEKVVEDKDYRRAEELQKEMASLTFLDPACGSGNFLVETYMSLRKLENKLIKLLYERDQKTKEWLIELERLSNVNLT